MSHSWRECVCARVCMFVCISWFVQFADNSAHTYALFSFLGRYSFDISFSPCLCGQITFCLYTHTETTNTCTHMINNQTSHAVENPEERSILHHIFFLFRILKFHSSSSNQNESKLIKLFTSCVFITNQCLEMSSNEKNIANVNRSLFGLNKAIAMFYVNFQHRRISTKVCVCVCMYECFGAEFPIIELYHKFNSSKTIKFSYVFPLHLNS